MKRGTGNRCHTVDGGVGGLRLPTLPVKAGQGAEHLCGVAHEVSLERVRERGTGGKKTDGKMGKFDS